MRKWKIIFAIAVLGVGGMFTAMFIGPHMIEQPTFRAYQAVLPTLPAGAVPATQPVQDLPGARREVAMADPQRLYKGQAYYHYYCVFCHGTDGEGQGLAGQSFFPPPADLRAARIQAYSDEQLRDAILNGIGHTPVMEYTILPQHRWYLVAYVRSLAKK